MSWKRLLWPSGLAAQIAACVVLALFVSQLLTAALAIFLEPPRRPPVPPWEAAVRAATIIRALDATSAEDRAGLASALADTDLVLSIEPHASFEPIAEPSETRPFRHDLEVQLAHSFPLQLALDDAPPSSGRLSIRAELRDGAIAHIETTAPHAPRGFVTFEVARFLFYLPFLTIVIATLTLWATRRVTAPLRAFSEAAETLGKERSAPPLPERGPAELQRAARSFNRMQEQVKRFLDARTKALTAVSHDLRTPITRLRLRVEAAVEDAEERRRMLRDLDRMDAMVASALSFLRDDHRNEPVASVDISSLLQAVCDEFAEIGSDVTYTGVANYPLRCRPDLLRRAVTNLVENATKYASRTTVTLTRDGSGSAIIQVDDDGPGIPDPDKDRAFDPFFRLDPERGTEAGGFGLGLSIAKTIFELHDGEMRLIDLQPTGLRVEVTLPEPHEAAGAAAPGRA